MLNDGPNAIAAIPVARDGTLITPVSTTLTDGQSGAQINPETGALASPDALGSAGSVKIVGQVWHIQKPSFRRAIALKLAILTYGMLRG